MESNHGRLCWYEEDSLEINVKAGEFFKGPLVGVSDWARDNCTSGTHKVVIEIKIIIFSTFFSCINWQ